MHAKRAAHAILRNYAGLNLPLTFCHKLENNYSDIADINMVCIYSNHESR